MFIERSFGAELTGVLPLKRNEWNEKSFNLGGTTEVIFFRPILRMRDFFILNTDSRKVRQR